jgi:hypothetical protein
LQLTIDYGSIQGISGLMKIPEKGVAHAESG